MGLELAIGAAIVGGVAAGTANIVSSIESERAGREATREGKRQQDTILAQAEEEVELLRERSARVATTQRARGGATGSVGNTGLVVQETLFFAFDEIRRARLSAGIAATQARRQGRSRARAFRIGSSLGVLRGVSEGAESVSTVQTAIERRRNQGGSRVRQ